MSKIYSKYIKNEEHVWYNSSNILYSVIFDDQTNNNKNLKIVFKGGRTYLYTDVSPLDYVSFRESESQGKTLNEVIRKYNCEKLNDTDLTNLENLKTYYQSLDDISINNYTIKYNNQSGEFQLLNNNVPIFEGLEGNVSLINLFRSMNINYNLIEFEKDEHIQTLTEFVHKTI
jgi:hypothetical protein